MRPLGSRSWLQAGKRAAKGKAAEVTVSVSTHVPKPHTPFQWAAMDSLETVANKQEMLSEEADYRIQSRGAGSRGLVTHTCAHLIDYASSRPDSVSC